MNDTVTAESTLVDLTEELDDGSVMVELNDEDVEAELSGPDFYDNLVNQIKDEDRLEEIASDVIEAVHSDEESRADWMNTISKGLDILGLGIQEVDEPFEGACSASHPLIIESAVKFQAKAGTELLPADGPVKTQILGTVTREMEERAMRVRQHMNWQTTTLMTEYYPDKEKMLFYLPLIGSSFTKTYWSAADGRPVSEFVTVDQFVVSYSATDLERCNRYTHVIYKTKDELRNDVANKLYVVDDFKTFGLPSELQLTEFQEKQARITGQTPTPNDFDAVYTLYEQHVNMYIPELDEDEYEIAKPYIITVCEDNETVIGIRRNWKEGDEKFKKKTIFTHYPFVPGMGFYGLGFIHLLGNLQMTLTSALRALIDAGQFANLPAGFKTKNVRMPKDMGPHKPGEFRDIEAAGQKLSEAFMVLPYKEPSGTLFQLLQFIEARSSKFADSTEQVVADSTNYGPVGTTMALLDASTKFFSAAHRRLHYSQKKELQILAQLNSEYLDEEIEYHIPGNTLNIKRDDYDARIDVIPVSDPNISSNAHRITLETTKTQMVQQLGPQAMAAVDMTEFLRRQFLALGEKDIDKIIPPKQEAQPQDPVSDIMSVINGQPIKAFPGQNHDAHMAVKAAWIEDPANGATPLMQPFAPVLQANIREHMVMKYQEQISGAMQVTGAATDDQTAEMVISEAARMVAENNKAAAAILNQGSPEAQIAKAELMRAETDIHELAHKKNKDFATAAMQAEKIKLDAIKEANRHQESRENLLAGITKERMKTGKDLAMSAVKGLQPTKGKKQE
jgi:uncharacterized protein YeeX (DUF496 family)